MLEYDELLYAICLDTKVKIVYVKILYAGILLC